MKRITGILSVLVVLGMLVTLSACGASEEGKLVGRWKTTMNMAELVNAGILAGGDEEMAEYLHVDDFGLNLQYTFNKDGTYVVAVDRAAAETAFESMRAKLKDGMIAYLEAMLAEEGLDMSLDELFEFAGFTLDDLLEEAVGDALLDQLIEVWETGGKWAAEGGKLYMTYDANAEIDKNVYDTYELSGNTLTLLEPVGGSADDALVYPIVLTKVG